MNRVRPDARFGRWTVVSFAGDKKWNCRCDCGTERPVLTSALGTGRSQSCGCTTGRARVPSREGMRQHGMTGTPTHNTWVGMIQRCTDPKHGSYALYGGRGITVCERWLRFEHFLTDMGEKPHGMSLDRIRSDLPYTPENCRWATRIQQNANRSISRFITCRGETHHLQEWSRRRGIKSGTIRVRLERGWTEDEALGFTLRQHNR